MLVSRLNSMVFDRARAAVSPAPPAQRPRPRTRPPPTARTPPPPPPPPQFLLEGIYPGDLSMVARWASCTSG